MQNNLKNWKGTLAVIGVDWGDSGKGRLIDDLSDGAHVVARFAGGSNTGHTVENEFGKFALHIIPSGIFNKRATCLVGRNVAVDLESLAGELDDLKKAGVYVQNLIIDPQASLTMPWHKLRDGIRQKIKGKKAQMNIGTTGRGVGPTYADRVERVGFLVCDLFETNFKSRFKEEVEIQNKFYGLSLDEGKIYSQYQQYAQLIKKYIGDTVKILRKAKGEGKNILFEGAQGYFLDIDAGTYPFVTSSNPGIVGIWRCFDLHPGNINQVIGITKAYMTRVGEGPMPTLIEGDESKIIIDKGKEKGTTTGRVRRPGWLDLVLLKEAIEVNSITGLALTKLDVLSYLNTIKVCVGYKLGVKNVGYLAHDATYLTKVKPIYKEFEGWSADISATREFRGLPPNAQKLIRFIEKEIGVPILFISVGPKRGQVIYK